MAHVTQAGSLWRRHGVTLLFSAAVVLLIALSLWWFAFLRRSVVEGQAAAAALLDREVALAAMRVGADARPGPVAGDARLMVVAAGSEPLVLPAHWVGDGADVQTGGGPDRRLLVQPTGHWVQVRQAQNDRRQAMVLGEGVFLMTLLLAVVSMLYRLSRAESRFRREMAEFLGHMTHELKTPLAGIKAVLDTLRHGRMPADQQATLVTMALQEVEREEHLIQNLLLAQRLRVPDQRLVRNVIDVAPLLRKFADHRLEILGGTVTIAVQCPDGLHGTGDDVALWTVLENLVDNAVKYGGHALVLRAAAHGDVLHVSVNDDGVGFDPGDALALFEPFVSTAAARQGKHGTGLGLSISRQLMRQMGGDLVATSPGAGQGATFQATLPLAPAAAPHG
ncbi:MAG: HAMP domain-containing histidine kinase [Deltaproteobacteria bacterium]|nr:HAMP domain-containing histidine kinase [Deltaproteobacteria bacterium]